MTTTYAERPLARGPHDSRRKGMCAAEFVAWLAKEPHSDHPQCLSPVLGQFLRTWNDALDDENRQKLKPYLHRAICTSSDGRDEERAWLCTDWMVRVCTPTWLRLIGLDESATALNDLAPLTDVVTAEAAQPALDEARERAAAAGAAARDAAWAAAWDATWAAAWDAAWAAAGAAARAAAWAAARAAAWAAARAAARDAAGAAARAAAWEKLKPTVLVLQGSALDLLDRMLKPESGAVAA